MNKRYFSFILILAIFVFCKCEGKSTSCEVGVSLNAEIIQNIKWEVINIQEGITFKSAKVNLFDTPQSIYIVEIDTNKAKAIFGVGLSEVLKPTSEQATQNNAFIAINGTYFNENEGYSRHFIKVDNVVKSPTQGNEFVTRATGVITIFHNGVDISNWNREKESENAGEAVDAIVSGPLLIDNNSDVEMWDNSFVSQRHPRSFMALINGNIVLGVVDGRDPERANGMSLMELKFFAEVLGYSDLINLDGGGSSTLYVKGQGTNGVVNVPSDGKERPVKSIIYFSFKQE